MIQGVLDTPGLGAVLAALPRARIVGGAVRDALAGLAVHDIDLATPDPPAAVIAALRAAGLKAVPTGLAHGTVTAVVGHRGFEITTLRRDVQTDGRHAVVAFTDDWQADAARRDFTINAMSMSPDGTLFDYFGGAEDLRAGVVRFVGDPAQRLAEDYLRLLRFFRFFARYARGPADPAALAAIAAAVPGLARLSAERVWSELKRILAAPAPEAAVALMQACGVLAAVLPGAGALRGGLPADPLLRLASLFAGDIDALAERLKLSAAERDRLHALRGPPPPADAAGLRRMLADVPNDILAGRAWLAGQGAAAPAILATPRPVFPLRGRDLEDFASGPALGERLRATRAWWLEGGCVADRAACLAHARG